MEQEIGRTEKRQGPFKIVKTYFKGHLARIGGEHIDGWTGPETVFVKKYLMPIGTFLVVPAVEQEERRAA